MDWAEHIVKRWKEGGFERDILEKEEDVSNLHLEHVPLDLLSVFFF